MRSGKPKRRKAPTIAKLKKTAWKLLSEVLRRSAADQAGGVDCYTCDGWGHWKIMQASHAIPGRTGTTLLDEEIIRVCCARCNIWLRGNYPVFVTKLIRERQSSNIPKAGEAASEALDWWEAKLSASRQVRKWSRSELEEKIESYKVRLAAIL